ncbi:HAMP domain-containing histidine kinase, partial [Myxococcota bacterium]|nr:HAMP domain-containing histidine kinase [Myxococcota bacterium]
GIPPADLPRVIQPYFTTKTSGSGLGLAICKRIAEDHGALFTLTSEVGEGTRAEIRF